MPKILTCAHIYLRLKNRIPAAFAARPLFHFLHFALHYKNVPPRPYFVLFSNDRALFSGGRKSRNKIIARPYGRPRPEYGLQRAP